MINICHFHNGTGGGVLSVIRNLLAYSQDEHIKNHIIYTINQKSKSGFQAPVLPGASTTQIFYYSPDWNFYHTCRQLAKLLPDEKTVLVAHDWLELGMASNLGLQNPVVQFLHGDYDYYYRLAEKHKEVIDIFACVSKSICQKLKNHLLIRKDDIHLALFPVPESPETNKPESEKVRNIFCVRDINDESKQFKLLPQINTLLNEKDMFVQWTIIGQGSTEEEIKRLLGVNTRYFPSLSNDEVMLEMCGHDIFIHPSLIEGFPVVVVEAMKAGAVPMIKDWDGATADLVIPEETGFYLKDGDAKGYAEKILMLHKDRNLLQRISIKAKETADSLFDPYKNTKVIEALFMVTAERKRLKKAKRVYGSRMDKRWIPNDWVKFLRN